MKQAYRHGEVLLVKIDSLPDELSPSASKIIMTGSHGNHHSFDKGVFYPRQEGITFGYLESKNTSLLHPEHSPQGGLIEDGYYQLIKQQEFTPDGLVPIVD